jgi:copper resistance protein B
MRIALAALWLVACHGLAVAREETSDPGWWAADQHYDSASMARARAHVRAEHGAGTTGFVYAERFEYRSNEGRPLAAFDAGAWWGSDLDRMRLRLEGDYGLDDSRFESAEVQVLWSHAIARFFDAETGLRHDTAPGGDRTFAAIGLRGIAPHWLEVDAAAFVSDDGDLSARLELEYDLLLTQRVILAMRGELDLSFDDVPRHHVGRGVSGLEAGLRLRYELRRGFAPYIGISFDHAYGRTADYRRDAGDATSALSLVAGLRMWF